MSNNKEKEYGQQKSWVCPNCKTELGKVVYGQLYLSGDITVNTDNQNLVVKCGECGARKTWFSYDRFTWFVNEIADAVLRRINNQANQ